MISAYDLQAAWGMISPASQSPTVGVYGCSRAGCLHWPAAYMQLAGARWQGVARCKSADILRASQVGGLHCVQCTSSPAVSTAHRRSLCTGHFVQLTKGQHSRDTENDGQHRADQLVQEDGQSLQDWRDQH